LQKQATNGAILGRAGVDGRPPGVLPMKIALLYREQARQVYHGAVFEAKKEILATMNKTLRQGENATVTKRKSSKVDEYIARCPKEAQGDLAKIRAAIRAAAAGATERTDYFQMPGYSYPGFDYDGMFVWFSFKEPHIRLHVRPPVIQEHRKELAGYATTKAIVSFPMGKSVPMTLVKKLVKASLKAMKEKAE
jgi:uncharacterized protein YdhG (YjbR/CyaY superfamily)